MKQKKKRSRKGRQIKQITQHGRAVTSELVLTLAKQLEEPAADPDLQGDQTHFLERLERLEGNAQQAALRLYYLYGMRRFLARRALGLRPEKVGFEEIPDDLKERRLALALEPGITPARMIIDGRGKVITCLGAGMPVTNVHKVEYDDLLIGVAGYAVWSSMHQSARKTVEDVDLFRLCFDIGQTGWLTPREKLETLFQMGPAVGTLLIAQLVSADRKRLDAYHHMYNMGATDDGDLRKWFRATGEVAAYLSLLADLGVEPALKSLGANLVLRDMVFALVFGSCVTRWRPRDVELWIVNDLEDERLDLFMLHNMMAAHHGGLRRLKLMVFKEALPPDDGSNQFLDMLYDFYNKEIESMRRLGIEIDQRAIWMRDASFLSRGGKPDWGDDLVDDINLLPPLRLDDLCLSGWQHSDQMPRYLIQRLLAGSTTAIHQTLFLPQEKLDYWSDMLGPLDQVRRG
jgi:hypothetical protein